MKYHMSDVYNKKDCLVWMKITYFYGSKECLYQQQDEENYSEYISEYMTICSNLKELLSIKFLTNDEFYHIREKIKEGI